MGTSLPSRLGATSQKPNSVIKMTDIYKFNNANVHRGTYVLSSETTSEYESVRYKLNLKRI